MIASEVGDLETVRVALAAGANVDGNERCSNVHVNHPLTLAAMGGHADVVALLLSQRAALLVGTESIFPTEGTILAAARRRKFRVASHLLSHVHMHPVMYRVRGVNSVGSRREAPAGELTRKEVAILLAEIARNAPSSEVVACSHFAMLVADGHLQATEPSGWEGLANRLAGKPGKWLAAQLTHVHARSTMCPSVSPEAMSLRFLVEVVLALGARPRWSPRRHSAYPPIFRARVRTLLLCAQRHGAATSAGAPEGGDEPAGAALLGRLPREVLLLLCEALGEAMWGYRAEVEGALRDLALT